MNCDVLVIGGGAAGFYGAIHVAQACPRARVVLVERGKEFLTKVKVSGGGRCNVTHAVFTPSDLATHYPRGEKELLGPFHSHASGDTVAFFESRGIALKIEEDGRMFPESNTSQTIIDCFLDEAEKLGIRLLNKTPVTDLSHHPEASFPWEVQTHDATLRAKYILMATGSNPKIWKLLQAKGHTIVSPVPSLFTFNITDDRIANIPGLSTHAEVTVLPPKSDLVLKSKKKNAEPPLVSEGPLLITHWGMSGPAILKLSAWGARQLHARSYSFRIAVNWVPEYHEEGLFLFLMEVKAVEKKTLLRTKLFNLPKRLWANLLQAAHIEKTTTWPQVTKVQLQDLARQLGHGVFHVRGKSTFKEEFVTAGGVTLTEINFKTFGSKVLPHLYFAGEIMDVDAITGGFNFQNAWTGAYIAAKSIAAKWAVNEGDGILGPP
ncbi:NAD(P)/FAD-dependent oxidoreductase [Maribacter sp. 2307ULW6-5]|uniref:NAD(P)/FAD-dependent oxidoreductase n=1 Tax=Maribacter sp. 2307ULW6-5 TaxID=3386275 RepID=UPI0039BC3643